MDAVTDCIFMGSKITADIDCSHKIKTFALWKESYDKPRQCIKKQRHHFVGASLIAQLVKNPPAVPESSVQFLGWEDPLEEG